MDNPSWHTSADNYNTIPIACKISQTQYSCKSQHFQNINIYEYIWIHIIDTYDMQNNAKYPILYNINTMFHAIYHKYLSIQILPY